MTGSEPAKKADSERWLVVWTESRAEKRVASRLSERGFEPWLPIVTERRRWSDRWKEVPIPLFPGYLFARLGPNPLSSLLRTPGVMTVVKDGRRPATLSAQFVASLRGAIEQRDAGAASVTEPVAFAPDDEVIVQEGPLAGVRGVVHELRSGRRLVIWIREIGRGVAFTIGSALVARCPDGNSATRTGQPTFSR